MAVLGDSDRAQVRKFFSDEPNGSMPLTKAEIRAAVDAVDAWVDSNATSFNSAIPQPARSALSAKQKARLLMHVVRRRYEVA